MCAGKFQDILICIYFNIKGEIKQHRLLPHLWDFLPESLFKKFLWFQQLRCKYFLVSLILCDSKLRYLRVVDKTRHLYHHFLTFKNVHRNKIIWIFGTAGETREHRGRAKVWIKAMLGLNARSKSRTIWSNKVKQEQDYKTEHFLSSAFCRNLLFNTTWTRCSLIWQRKLLKARFLLKKPNFLIMLRYTHLSAYFMFLKCYP